MSGCADFSVDTQCIVMRDCETGRSRGFGFETLSSSGEADDDAVTNLNEFELNGRRLRCNLPNDRPSGGGRGRGDENICQPR
jgi:RNA recognition motif-containing protein